MEEAGCEVEPEEALGFGPEGSRMKESRPRGPDACCALSPVRNSRRSRAQRVGVG